MKLFIMTSIVMMSLSSAFAYHWTVKALYNYVNNEENPTHVIDPENFIVSETKHFINNAMLQQPNVDTYLIILDSIDPYYYNSYSQKIDVIKFLEEFVFMLYPDRNKRDDSLFILYSINDRVYKYRTGVNAQKVFSDNFLSNVAESLKNDLRNSRYNDAFKNLFTELYKESSYLIPIIIFIIIIAVIVIIIWASRLESRKIRRAKLLHKRFKTLEQIKNEGKDVNLFIQENCAICLDKVHHKDETNADTNSNEVFLGCGHNFHKDCLSDWLQNSDVCPLCRQLVDGSNRAPSRVIDALFDMQRVHFNNYFTTTEITRITTSTDGNIWQQYKTDYGNNYSTNYSYDNNSGGTYGSW